MSTAVKSNYYALCICVLSEKIPEEAFNAMGLTSVKTKASKLENRLSGREPEDVKEMLRLKKTLTWKQVGEIFGISDQAAYQRVRRFMKRKE